MVNIWIARTAQGVLHRTSGVSRQDADRIGREIAAFLDKPVNLDEAITAFGGDAIAATEALTKALVAGDGRSPLLRR
jgi:hypothetical protein